MSSHYHAVVFYGILLPKDYEQQGDEEEVLRSLKVKFAGYTDDSALAIEESIIEDSADDSRQGPIALPIPDSGKVRRWWTRMRKVTELLGLPPIQPRWYMISGWS